VGYKAVEIKRCPCGGRGKTELTSYCCCLKIEVEVKVERKRLKQRRRNVEVREVKKMVSSTRSCGVVVGVCACVSTSTQNLGPLYPVKSCTTRFALSIPLRHTEGHLAFMLPSRARMKREAEVQCSETVHRM
jgi:hypothetical protein